MTLGENKKIALALIEEYSPNNPLLTDDEDISSRLNLIYSPNYQELSQNKKIIKTKVLKEIIGTTEEGYEEYSLPSNMYQLRKVFALNDKNIEVEPDYKIIGKKIYVNKESDAKYILEYFVYPSVITEETDDDFTLELDQDVQMLLPYVVAYDVIKSDPSSDSTPFLTEYKRKLDALDTRREISSAVVEEGVL
jgi:hypothetical protein